MYLDESYDAGEVLIGTVRSERGALKPSKSSLLRLDVLILVEALRGEDDAVGSVWHCVTLLVAPCAVSQHWRTLGLSTVEDRGSHISSTLTGRMYS